MLTRRHIRTKVMQSIYAMYQNGSDDLIKQEKFLTYSLQSIYDLYLTLMSALIEIQKNEKELIQKRSLKYLATAEDKSPNLKFINNYILNFFLENEILKNEIDNKKINTWQQNNDIILMLIKTIKESDIYIEYMINNENNLKEDQIFIEKIFSEIIAPNEKLFEYIEDNKLTWIDDIPVVNTCIAKQLLEIDIKTKSSFKLPKTFKNDEDREFANLLFRKTILNEKDFTKFYEDKTPNWDINRIAVLDTIIIKMAICEMLKFSSIPEKVTINEYVEIAKEYSTPNSSIFINGILDVIAKEFKAKNMLNKIGRGLILN